MKKIILFITFVLINIYFFGQDNIGDEDNPGLPNIIPPSPTAYELGKYGQIPVGLFTGTPNVNIPLYTYRTKNLALPISLSYSSNGLKVDQLSSNVGLGWSLNIGGVVTRIVRDIDDDECNLFFPEEDLAGSPGNNPMALEYFHNASSPDNDSEPDLYMYNFNGHTGKFVFDNDKKIILIPHDDIRIETIYDDNTERGGFKITTSDGVQYVFLTRELTRSYSSNTGKPLPTFTYNTWYLTRIIHPLGDEINFIYEGSGYTYTSGISESINMVEYPQSACELLYSPNFTFPITSVEHYANITEKRISEIYSNNPYDGSIHITYDVNHPDLTIPGYGIVSDILVKDKSSTEVEKFSFDYFTTDNDRIFLESVTFLDVSKNYHFDYIEPTGFPERLSFGQDHWGYFNGEESNSTLVPKPLHENWEGYFAGFENAAKRNPEFAYAQKGLLNKITYPTKGYNQFFYELNSYYGEKIIYPNPETISFHVITDELTPSAQDIQYITNVPFSQKLYITGYSVGINPDCETKDFPPDTKAYFNIWDDEDGVFLLLTGTNPLHSTYDLEILPGMLAETYYANIEEGKNYTLKLRVNSFCLAAYTQVKLFTEEPQTITTNIETGGCRIQRIIAHDPVEGNTETTRYYYGPLTNKEKSSGDPGKPPKYLSFIEQGILCENGMTMEFVNRLLVASSSLLSLFNSGGSNIYYEYVTVSKGNDNFIGGAEEHRFIINRDLVGNNVWGNNIINAPLTNFGWDNGMERKVSYYRKATDGSLLPTSSSENFYRTDERNYDEAFGYTIRKKYDFPLWGDIVHECTQEDMTKSWEYTTCTNTNIDHHHSWFLVPFGEVVCISLSGGGPNMVTSTIYHPCSEFYVGYPLTYPRYIENLDILTYKNISYWHYLYKTVSKQFDENGLNPVIATTRYYYDNEEHLQLTRTSTSTSSDDSLVQITYYPDDVTGTNSLPGGNLTGEEYDAICALKKDAQFRIAEPIQSESYRNLNKLYINRTKYKDWEDLILPEVIQRSKAGNPLEDRIYYHQYDIKGNPVEVSKADGMDITYLWGYQYSKVIAEIQNGTYDQVMNNLGISYPQLQDKSATELRSIFSNLRENMENAMITSFTYDPLVGITSQTDPNGKTTWYEYDAFGRLETVKDNDSKVIKHVDYKYLEP